MLTATNINFSYANTNEPILTNVSLSVEDGKRLALVGDSGCGKSTLAKILSGYLKPNSGEVLYRGAPLPSSGYNPVQMISQHPELAVNPRWKMSRVLNECWEPDEELRRAMGIEDEWLSRWPSELSGGELQRFCIARVLSAETKFLICDEISTMLDMITQAQIWQILLDISSKNGLGMIVVTHNMELAARVCDEVIYLPEINSR